MFNTAFPFDEKQALIHAMQQVPAATGGEINQEQSSNSDSDSAMLKEELEQYGEEDSEDESIRALEERENSALARKRQVKMANKQAG